MTFTRRQFSKGELPHPVHSQYAGSNKYNQYFYIKVGLIEDVDSDKYVMSVNWEPSGSGIRDKVPISFPYAGPAGCIAILPEKGALGIFAFFNEGDGKGSPLLVGYLPAGLDAGLNFNVVQRLPDSLSTTDTNKIQFKFRKLLDGDLNIVSPGGASVFLNRNVEIQDSAQDSIFIREDDQAILNTSLNHYIFTDGVAVNAGPAIRNSLGIYDKTGKKIDNNGSIMALSDGKENVYIVPFGKEISYDTQFYTEYRVDVGDLGDGKLDLNDINSSSPLSTRSPIVTMAMGNYIGADKTDPQKYGLILRPRLFSSSKDAVGSFSLEKCNQNNIVDEPAIIGLAYAMHFLKSNCFIGVDKEGHYYMNLPGSKANPLGAGRSMSILAQGNLKEIWGVTTAENNSWDLTTKGGIVWDIGNHAPVSKSRSIDITTTRGIKIRVNDADDEGYAKQEDYYGNVNESVTGDKTQDCINLTLKINGLKTENISGSSVTSIQSDETVSVLGVSSEIAIKEKQCKFGKRKTTITSGNDELEVTKGNIKESITTFGKRITTITSGGIEETIRTGSYKTKINVGNYKLNVSTGKIEVKTSAGTVTISGTTVDIKGSIMVNINSSLVKIGKGAPIGGVVAGLPGIPTHQDFVTGLPLKGSMKVSVSA